MAEKVDVKVTNKETTSRNKKTPFNWKVILVIVVVVVALGAAFYFWNEANTSDGETSEAVAANNQEESDQIISSLSLVLYTDSEDQPTVARIEDPEVLIATNEDFYRNAQAGDYLVLYPNRAIIYRESENLVVNVVPIINTNGITP